ncbi:hypothetical protein BD408DRAFT_423939 [Parasitella parasitica]|nr:hypothetical protein BD408DRAFT_423939 [Parasitella parasitica]
MVNNRLFEYLATRCPFLDVLDVSHIIKPYDNNIQVKINMPHHVFKLISIEKLQLGLRIEDSGFQCNHCSTIFSLEETQKTQQQMKRQIRSQQVIERKYPERWYHLYQSHSKSGDKNSLNGSINRLQPRIQRLDQVDVEKIKNLDVTRQLWEQISFVGSRIKYEDKNKWQRDIPFGYFSVRCRSVHNMRFEGITL